MTKNVHVSLFCCVLAIILAFTFIGTSTAEISFVNFYCFNDRGNFTENSTYPQNLVQALSDLYSESSTSHFSNTTDGSGQDKVYSLYMCRYDLSVETCQSCIKEAALSIVSYCPVQKEAIIWYEQCTLRYANRTIFSKEEEEILAWRKTLQTVSDVSQFNQTVEDTLDDLIDEAVSEISTEYFAIGETSISTTQNLYALVQCTPDITSFECAKCLKFALNQTDLCCSLSVWAMVFLPSCQLRYDLSPFYGKEAAAQPAPPPPPSPPPPPFTSSDAPRSPPSTVSGDASPPPPSPSTSTLGSSDGGLRHSGASYTAIVFVAVGLVASQLL